MNIFIEGIQGTGKSTLLTKLGQALPDYQVYREGDLSPAELAWCSYMSAREFQEALKCFPKLEQEIMGKTAREEEQYVTAYTQILTEEPGFYAYMEQYEIYNGRKQEQAFHDIIRKRYEALTGTRQIFECSFFQNSLETMMLFYENTDGEIFNFYREMYGILKEKDFLLLYLETEDLEEIILRIKKERSDIHGEEMWYPLMINYLKESPYGQRHHYETFQDMIAHFRRRWKLEKQMITDFLGERCMILPAGKYDLNRVLEQIRTVQ